MKKLLGIVVLGLFWCNVGAAECIKGNCINGQGTWSLPSGYKYVGEWKNGKRHGQGTRTSVDGEVMKGIWKEGELIEPN